MPITVLATHPNQPIPPSLALGGIRVLSGVLECLFKGDGTGGVTRDTVTFNVGRVNLGTGVGPTASCVVSLASFAYDGAASNLLWAVDAASVTAFVNEDRGSGIADLQVTANLAVKGPNAMILRVNYIVFHFPS
jgi:hypothetical protein